MGHVSMPGAVVRRLVAFSQQRGSAMTTVKARDEKLSTIVPAEYAHQVKTSARAAGKSVSGYVKLALDAALSNPHRQSSLIACAIHAELGRLHLRLEARSVGVTDEALASDIADHLGRVEVLMRSLTRLVLAEIEP